MKTNIERVLDYLWSAGRLRFFYNADERLQAFVHQARPAPGKAAQGVYISSAETAPFLEMFGQLLHHSDIPAVPVLHVKHWPLRAQMTRYVEPMLHAAQEIRCALAESGDAKGR